MLTIVLVMAGIVVGYILARVRSWYKNKSDQEQLESLSHFAKQYGLSHVPGETISAFRKRVTWAEQSRTMLRGYSNK